MGDIGDVITYRHVKFCVNRLRGFGVLTPPILPFSIGLARRPYSTVSTIPRFTGDSVKRINVFKALTALVLKVAPKSPQTISVLVCAMTLADLSTMYLFSAELLGPGPSK